MCREFIVRFAIFLFFVFLPCFAFAKQKKEQSITLYLKNETPFSVGIQQEFYGGIDVVSLSPYEEKSIKIKTSLKETEELIFYYYFDILYKSLYIDSLKSNQQFFSIKAFEKHHSETITLPKKINFNSVGVIINNLSSNSLSLTRVNSFIQLKDNKKDIGITMPANSKASFIKQSKELQSKIQIYNTNISFPDIHYLDGYIYTFSFDGSTVELEDARPIAKIGEKSWTINPNEKSSAQKLISSKNGDFFYYMDNFIGENENGAAYRMASLNCLNTHGSKKWNVRLSEKNGVMLYDMATCGNAIFAVGQKANQRRGFSALYSKSGNQLDIKEFSSNSIFNALAKLSENSFLLAGFKEKPVLVKATVKENKIHYEQISFDSEKLDSKISKMIPFYDESENAIYLFCNRKNKSSKAYSLGSNGEIVEIPLNNNIQSISSVCKTEGSIILGGETVSAKNSSAIVLKLDSKSKEIKILHQDENPYSYVSKLIFNTQTNELVVSGTLGAKSRFGAGGTPFIMALNSESGSEIWKTVYTKEDGNLILDFAPCEDYGFVELFCNVADYSRSRKITSKKIIRANATGKYK